MTVIPKNHNQKSPMSNTAIIRIQKKTRNLRSAYPRREPKSLSPEYRFSACFSPSRITKDEHTNTKLNIHPNKRESSCDKSDFKSHLEDNIKIWNPKRQTLIHNPRFRRISNLPSSTIYSNLNSMSPNSSSKQICKITRFKTETENQSSAPNNVTEVKSGPTSRKYKIVDKEDYEKEANSNIEATKLNKIKEIIKRNLK